MPERTRAIDLLTAITLVIAFGGLFIGRLMIYPVAVASGWAPQLVPHYLDGTLDTEPSSSCSASRLTTSSPAEGRAMKRVGR